MATDDNYWHDSDSSNYSYEDDDDVRYDDIISRGGGDTPIRTSLSWVYQCYSKRGGEMYEGLSTHRLPSSAIKLEYNTADNVLLEQAKLEIKQALHQARLKLFGTDNKQIITTKAAYAAMLPRALLVAFNEYLRYSRANSPSTTAQAWSFNDIIIFLLCEKVMRLYNTSASKLKFFGLSGDDYDAYLRVRKALTKADVPYSKRSADGAPSRVPANSFDPILDDAIQACNKEWSRLSFVPGSSNADVDDDKYPNSSPKWKQYDMKTTPTKDKKLKPVVHCVTVVGSGFIVFIAPDKLGISLGDMLRSAINHLEPTRQASLRALLTLFIDRGYMELAKAQGINPTNLVQIVEEEGAKFLGTMKDSKQFAFQIVDVNEGSRVVNNRPIIQAHGTRMNFTARAGNIQATVVRQGGGKVRAARIASNLPEAQRYVWVYETSRQMVRVPNQERPPPQPANASRKQQIDHAWNEFLASVTVLTLLQRTVDWFLARLFCFSSTSFHAAVNVKAAAYLNTSSLREVHANCLQILRLNPRNTITVQNATHIEDENLPLQRGSHVGVTDQTTSTSDEKCTAAYSAAWQP